MVLASALALSGCGDGGGKKLSHAVMTTQPAPLGEGSGKALSGVVQEAHEISLGFKTPGQIMTIHVKEGDRVAKGQLIATLDDEDYKLGATAYEIQYKQLSDEVARLEKLYEAKSVSANEFEKAEAGLRQVETQLQTYRNKLDYTRLYAPVAGYVQAVNYNPAEMVDAGTPVITLLDMHRMEVEVNLPLDIYKKRDRFGTITCQLTADRTKTYEMKTVYIAPKADGMQLHKMQLAFDNDDLGDMLAASGMNVEVQIEILEEGQQAGQMTLPAHAVFQEGGQTYVWTVSAQEEVHKQAVTLIGLDAKGRAIVTGLKGQEEVVKAGVTMLQEGEKVTVVGKDSETNIGGLV